MRVRLLVLVLVPLVLGQLPRGRPRWARQRAVSCGSGEGCASMIDHWTASRTSTLPTHPSIHPSTHPEQGKVATAAAAAAGGGAAEQPSAEEHPAAATTVELLFDGAVLQDKAGNRVKDPAKALEGRAVGLLFGAMWWCVYGWVWGCGGLVRMAVSMCVSTRISFGDWRPFVIQPHVPVLVSAHPGVAAGGRPRQGHRDRWVGGWVGG